MAQYFRTIGEHPTFDSICYVFFLRYLRLNFFVDLNYKICRSWRWQILCTECDTNLADAFIFGINCDIFGENSLLTSLLTPLEMADFKQDGLLALVFHRDSRLLLK
tara:strand:- start:196 stop:513 length:318 start_codon:yes stop_codon:yes gene_type:complete